MNEQKQIPFYVFVDDVNANRFVKYDVMPYFMNAYNERKKSARPKTYDEFLEFVEGMSLYQFWGRCEYEVVLTPWCSRTPDIKIDVHWQLEPNIELVTRILMHNLGLQQ